MNWLIKDSCFNMHANNKNESIFTVANGNIGFRGDFEEDIPDEYKKYSLSGTYINGFYETEVIQYAERGHGFADYSQTMLNVCNPKSINIYVDGVHFSMFEGKVLSCEKGLDMKKGISKREILWDNGKGKEVKIEIIRLVSLEIQDSALIQYKITATKDSCDIKIETKINGDVTNKIVEGDPRVGSGLKGRTLETDCAAIKKMNHKTISFLKQTTFNSKLSVACAAFDSFEAEKDIESKHTWDTHSVSASHSFGLEKDQEAALTRYISFSASTSNKGDLTDYVCKRVFENSEKGYNSFFEGQVTFLNEFWNVADIEIDAKNKYTQSMRFNIFQLLQSVGRSGVTSICAKGLSGEGYEGHYFWESEVYILPVFLYTMPELAKNLLLYRYTILDKARNQARLLGHGKGALYSWRSINGDECSAYFPAGSAQYHISADVAYGVNRYLAATNDIEFILKYGGEIVFETARLWIDAGHYNDKKGGQFCIDCVTGPDEYTALVDNNCYTNLMAKENLCFAVKLYERLKTENENEFNALCEKIDLQPEEITAFEKAYKNMYIPFDNEMGIHMQDDTFLNKKVLDFHALPEEKRPLLIHYHPLFIYRHQVCKQADLMLAEFLLPDQFTKEQKKKDYEYYEKVTTHDSSLSSSIFCIMAAEIGKLDEAYTYFVKTVRTDLDDIQKNTGDGLHMANMAGAWCSVINGFAGMRMIDGNLSFSPSLPKQWEGYRFKIVCKETLLCVSVEKNDTSYTIETGPDLTLYHRGELIAVKAGHTVRIS